MATFHRMKVTLRMFTVAGLVMLLSRSTQASGEWAFTENRSGGPHVYEYKHAENDYEHLKDKSPPTSQLRNVAYSVTLYNATEWTMNYTLNGRTGPSMRPGESIVWTVMGAQENPAVFVISFGHGNGREIQYSLRNNCVFEFRHRKDIVDLYRLQFGRTFTTRSAETFTNVEGRTWVCQKRDDATIYRFTEAARTKDFIELKCVTDNHDTVRIYQSQISYHQLRDHNHPNERVWTSTENSHGHWN